MCLPAPPGSSKRRSSRPPLRVCSTKQDCTCRIARYWETEPLYQRALAIREQQLGAEHPDTATSLNNLALLYYAQGKYSEAEPLLLRALAIYEQQLGREHPTTQAVREMYSLLLRTTGRDAEAKQLEESS